MSDGPDLSQWDFWWGINGAELLESKRASGTERPTTETLTTVVVPALIEASRASSSPNVRSAALLALAKLGDQIDTATRAEHLLNCIEQLASESQQVTETAALALGVLGDEREVPLLAALMHDDPTGRRAMRGSAVPLRTRSFAAYGLGLIAERNVSNDVRRTIAAHLIEVLEQPHFAWDDLKVGAMDALGLVRLAWPSTLQSPYVGPHAAHIADRSALITYLVHYLDPEHEREHLEARHWVVRAHTPLAIVRLLHGDTTRSDVLPAEAADVYDTAVSLLLRICSEPPTEHAQIQRSALIALGRARSVPAALAPNARREELAEAVSAHLLETATQSKDNQQEYFALIALAENFGRTSGYALGAGEQSQVQAQLMALASKAKGSKGPWSSLALGVHGRAVLERGGTLDWALVSSLRMTFNTDKTPQTTGAHALALELIQDRGSCSDLLRRFQQDFNGSPMTSCYLARALGSLDAHEALDPIKAELQRYRKLAVAPTTTELQAKYDWAFVALAAPAVGRLGGRTEVPYLVDLLREAGDEASRGGVAIALGLLGDASSIAPLVALLRDTDTPDAARAAAATALGLVCDTAGRPWNASYLRHANYRVNTLCLDDEAGTGLFERL